MADDKESKNIKPITLSEALANLPPASEWFRLSESGKRELQRIKVSSEISKQVGFVLGGSFYPPKARL